MFGLSTRVKMMVGFTVWHRHPVVQDALPLPMDFLGFGRCHKDDGALAKCQSHISKCSRLSFRPSNKDVCWSKVTCFSIWLDVPYSFIDCLFCSFPCYGSIPIVSQSFTRMFGFLWGHWWQYLCHTCAVFSSQFHSAQWHIILLCELTNFNFSFKQCYLPWKPDVAQHEAIATTMFHQH